MKDVRLFVGAFVLVVLSISIAGCAQTLVCAPPSSIIGNKCCLDADDNSICDAEEESSDDVELVRPVQEEEEPVSDEPDGVVSFVNSFENTWNRKSYTALHGMFVNDVSKRYTPQEFNFLARKLDKNLGVKAVSVKSVKDGEVRFTVFTNGVSKDVSGYVTEEDGEYRFEAFYLFIDLTPSDACGTDESCYMDYAVISKDKNYCDDAGSLKADCVLKFGISNELTDKIDDCLEILEYYGRVECLEKVAVNENSIEPCWEATHDKQMFECMGKVAAARDSVKDCGGFVSASGYSATRLQEAYCITGYVKETADTSACALIDRRSDVVLGAMQEGCYKMSFP